MAPDRNGHWRQAPLPTYATSYRATDADLAYWLRDMAPGDVAEYLSRLMSPEPGGQIIEPLGEDRARAIWAAYERESQWLALAIAAPKVERTPVHWAGPDVTLATEDRASSLREIATPGEELTLRPMTIAESTAITAEAEPEEPAGMAIPGPTEPVTAFAAADASNTTATGATGETGRPARPADHVPAGRFVDSSRPVIKTREEIAELLAARRARLGFAS
jgi:hypothetical protein